MEKRCETCRAVFYKKVNVSLKKWSTAKYCSSECVNTIVNLRDYIKKHGVWNKGRTNIWSKEHIEAIKIKNTGNSYTKGRKRPNLSKEKNPAWKGGITLQNKMDRVKFSTITAQEVFIRDNYTCQLCNQYGGTLHADHIKSWENYPKLRFDLNNCRTLCRACHYYITFKRKIPINSRWSLNFTRRIV